MIQILIAKNESLQEKKKTRQIDDDNDAYDDGDERQARERK
jgi:hypothetical protein